jgi:hypothetical protein
MLTYTPQASTNQSTPGYSEYKTTPPIMYPNTNPQPDSKYFPQPSPNPAASVQYSNNAQYPNNAQYFPQQNVVRPPVAVPVYGAPAAAQPVRPTQTPSEPKVGPPKLFLGMMLFVAFGAGMIYFFTKSDDAPSAE